MRRAALIVSVCAVTVLATHAQQKPSVADLKTTAEATGYKSTSTYDDVVKFMKTVDEASPIVFYTTYGTTTEGRAMPMAVVGTSRMRNETKNRTLLSATSCGHKTSKRGRIQAPSSPGAWGAAPRA